MAAWRRTRYALRAGAERLDQSHRAILNSLRRRRYRLWRAVSRLNASHAKWAWASLVWIALTDAYIRMIAVGWFSDPKFF